MTKEEFIEKCRAASAAYNEKAKRYFDIVIKKARRRINEEIGAPQEQDNTQEKDEHIS